MFYGPGAGSMAAGSAVVGDVIDIARNINLGLDLAHILHVLR